MNLARIFLKVKLLQTPDTIKKYFLFCCTILLAFAANAQNIAIPNYNQQKIDFYLGTSITPQGESKISQLTLPIKPIPSDLR